MSKSRWMGMGTAVVIGVASMGATASADEVAVDASGSISIGAPSSATATSTTTAAPAPATTDAPTTAVAPEKKDAFNRTFAFGVSGGIGSPLGYGGILVNVAPIKYLILEIGGGAGGRFGPAIAEMVRAGFPDGNQMFTLGVGLSQNITTSYVRDKFPTQTADSAPGVSHFFNAEAAYEYRFVKQRFWTRLGLGVATLLNANKFSGLCGANDVLCSNEATGFTPVSVSQNKGTITAYIHLDIGGFFGF